ncbi:hypothetical protein M407DRAFT_13409 [Tulasnella calospora MUT 4182]|uniref:DUF3445 domain-containing protein n=1 Tax=Tulasnella calospora MUT 4182 TaxID=1051891 RepID=A0A0C3QX69_9AGAM|nr:hypothetical protein M407DRAFT_13409 [Tulasnella calospora MUT 4182]
MEDWQVLLLSSLVSAIGFFAWLARVRKTNSAPHVAAALPNEKTGETLDVFRCPVIEALEDSDILNTPPVAYRPFRWGPNYHITMGLRQGEWNNWIQLDNRFAEYHGIKTDRVLRRGNKCVQTLPARDGIAKETVYELAEYLSRRYPSIYAVERHEPSPGDFGWYGEVQIKTVAIVPLGATYDLDEEDSMKVAGLLVPDDLALMLSGPDGKHYLQAGSICLAGSWRLEDKIGLPLSAIHTSADVPQYREKLEFSMDRFFSKLQPDKLTLRNNVLLPKHIYFRSERQSLRRLPRTGAILFTIRTYYEPVTSLAREPGVPGRMASALRSWSEDVAIYKGQARYKDVLLEYLDRMHENQVREGTDSAATKYPF